MQRLRGSAALPGQSQFVRTSINPGKPRSFRALEHRQSSGTSGGVKVWIAVARGMNALCMAGLRRVRQH
jgi:hypothetical protein